MRTACPWPWKLHNSRLAQGGAVFGGGKGGSGGTTYQTQQTTIPPEVRARYDAVNARAEQVAQQPFRPYEGQFVAPLTATQQQGIQQIAGAGQGYQPYQQAATGALTGAAEAALPYYGQAAQSLQGGAQAALPLYGQAAQGIQQAQTAGAPYTGMATAAGLAGTQAVNPAALQTNQYMDPYVQSVIDPTMAALRQQQQAEQSQLMGSQAMRGAFGGDRGSIAAANLARQQGLASAQTEAGLRSQAYQQALQAAQQQQGVGLQAAQANRAALQQFAPQALAIGQQAFQQPMAAAQAQQGLGQGLFGMGQGLAQGQQNIGQGLLGYGQGVAGSLAGLGQQGTQTGLAAGQTLLGAGTLEQQTQQQLNAALYNQYLQQQGYPFQVAQFLANIALGTGPLYGSTTTGVTGQPTPFFSDERVKEDITEIGRTHDGQKIIKFRYKGEPEGTSHIGLSAQDVEKHHPEAVSETPEGIKAVDYDAATKHAERAYGGGLLPSSEGGAVHPSMAGLGFASGGTPVPGMNPGSEKAIQDLLPKGLAPTMRPAFAEGGEAERLRKMYPWGAVGSPGKGAGWAPELAVKPQAPLGSGVQFQRPSQQPTGLSQTISAVKSGLGAIEDAEKIGKYGEKAYDWAKDTVGNIRDKMELPGLTRQAAEYAATEGFNPMAARGGRIGYEDGGDVDESPAIPYGGDETPLGKLTSHQVTPAKLETPKLDMSGGKSGGQQKDGAGKAIGSLIGAGLGAFLGPAGAGVGSTLGGMGLGSSLGGMFGGLFARGGEVDPTMMADAKRRIAGIESGGRYDALGPMVKGDRAYGKFQVMGRNIPSWTEEALGRRMTPEEFLKNPEAQERVFEHHFGKSLKQYGNLADAASIWHSGVPLNEARRQGRRDVNMSTEDYVAKLMGGAPPAELHMREGASRPRVAGLAPQVTDVEDLNEEPTGLAPVDTGKDFEMPERFTRFAAGGLVPRNSYEEGGVPAMAPTAVPEEEQDSFWQRLNRAVPINLPTAPSGAPVAPSPTVAPAPSTTGVAPPTNDGGLDELALDAMRREREAAAAPPKPTTGVAPPTATPSPARDIRTEGDFDLAGYNRPATAAPSPDAGRGPQRDFFDRAGDWMGRNQSWLLPAVSGIGKMLASPSPYLGVAVGQGLGEFAQMYPAMSFKQQGLDIQQAQAAANISRYFSQNIQEYFENGRRMYRDKITGDRMNEDEFNKKRLAFIQQFMPNFRVPSAEAAEATKIAPTPVETITPPGAGAPAAGAPAAGAPAAGAPAAGAPAAGAPAVAGIDIAAANARVIPLESPQYLRGEIAKLEDNRREAVKSGNTENANALSAQIAKYQKDIEDIESGARVPRDPRTGEPVMDWFKQAARIAEQKAKSAEAFEAAKKYREEARATGDAMLNLSRLTANYNSIPKTGLMAPGALANQRATLLGGFGTALSILGTPPQSINSIVGGAQALNKDSVTLAKELTQAMGNREAASVFEAITNATPSIMNTPEGFGRIAAGLEMALAYKQLKGEYATQYASTNQNLDNFDRDFKAAFPISAFTAAGIVKSLPEVPSEGRPFTRRNLMTFLQQNPNNRAADAQIDAEMGNGTAAALRSVMANRPLFAKLGVQYE